MLTVKELAKQTGYSERHIRRIAAQIEVKPEYKNMGPGLYFRVFTEKDAASIKAALGKPDKKNA